MRPNVFSRVYAVLVDWARGRAKTVVLKAPKERPDLLFVVFALAICLVALYIGAWTSHV